jgi:hypothetical protein
MLVYKDKIIKYELRKNEVRDKWSRLDENK